MAVQEDVAKKDPEGRVMNANNVRYEERDGRGEVMFMLVLMEEMEKRRWRKNGKMHIETDIQKTLLY